MKKLLSFLRKCKKGFTLMECVCAIAVVSLLSAVILPLTAAAIRSMRASDNLRTVAASASAKNASVTTDQNNNSETLYVTINYKNLTGMHAESAFMFTKTNASGGDEGEITVTYYDLKYGKETEEPKK